MMFLVLASLLLILPVKSQLSVTWNGSTITGPVLIYFDEILIDQYRTAVIGDVSRPGALVCRSEDMGGIVSWHFTSGLPVSNLSRNKVPTIIQIGRSEIGSMTPSVSRLSKTRMFESDSTEQNGVWHCRLNAIGERDEFGATYDDQINVGIFASRSRGMILTIESMKLESSFFESTPPTFTLHADTSGGPPTNYTWTRDGQLITHGNRYNISITVNGRNQIEYEESRYRSTLTVTGNLPGFYQYFATNRATPTPLTSNYTIEGSRPTNLGVVQNGLESVLVSWTEPMSPPVMGYRVTVQPGGVHMTVSSSPVTVNLLPGVVYSVLVTSLSQHLSSQPVGPVLVEVRVDCSDPVLPSNANGSLGEVTSTTEGATVNFQCEEGLHLLSGHYTSLIQCTHVNNMGLWTPNPATLLCIREVTVTVPLSTMMHISESSFCDCTTSTVIVGVVTFPLGVVCGAVGAVLVVFCALKWRAGRGKLDLNPAGGVYEDVKTGPLYEDVSPATAAAPRVTPGPQLELKENVAYGDVEIK